VANQSEVVSGQYVAVSGGKTQPYYTLSPTAAAAQMGLDMHKHFSETAVEPNVYAVIVTSPIGLLYRYHVEIVEDGIAHAVEIPPETKRIGPWTIQWNDVWKGGSFVCYLGDCLMMSGETMEEAEQKVRATMKRTNPQPDEEEKR